MQQIHSRVLQLNILLALLYWGLGRASILLAPEPSYATGIWPSAGVAFIAVLVGGYRYMPGVFVGAALVNFGLVTGTLKVPQFADSVIMALSIGGAATLQAAFGAWLVKRFVGYPTALETPASILRFLILAGPVACLVGASLSSAVLYQGGAFSLEPVGVHWITWWLGDTVGTILVGLLGLCLIGHPRTVWRPRRTSVAAPLVLACIPLVVAQVGTSSLLAQRQQAEFDYVAETVTAKLELATLRASQALDTLTVLFQGSQLVEPAEFERIAARQLDGATALSWVAWVPAGAGTVRDSLMAHGAGPDGNPGRYISPGDGDAAAAWLTPERIDAYMLPDTLAAPTPQLFLTSTGNREPALLIGTVDSQPASPAGRPKGFILAPVDLAELAAGVVPARFGGLLNVNLRSDGGPARQARILNQARKPGTEAFAWEDTIDFNGQTWHVDVLGLPGEYERSWVTHALVTASAGVVYSLVLALLLLADSGRKVRVERFFSRIARPRTSPQRA